MDVLMYCGCVVVCVCGLGVWLCGCVFGGFVVCGVVVFGGFWLFCFVYFCFGVF
jgi:hypothetical protein